MSLTKQKVRGAYYTPDHICRSLVKWVIRSETDRLLDPACGDGRFLACHRHAVGVEFDPSAVSAAVRRAPGAQIHAADFFDWATVTQERFDCAAGNPPFIRYQRFAGKVRQRALRLCAQFGAQFSALTSSWAPFLVATAGLLKPGGRMAFVVPAEIGHAPYAAPLLEFLGRHFARVQLLAVRKKLFPRLSEDAWLLYAEEFGSSTDEMLLCQLDRFETTIRRPIRGVFITFVDWRKWNCRLRPFLLPPEALQVYEHVRERRESLQLADVARVGIGYVTGANGFFHLRPSTADAARIPDRFLMPSVRSTRDLPPRILTRSNVDAWLRNDEEVLLLRLDSSMTLPASVTRYLNSSASTLARAAYKCRNRNPWYVVPDVRIPDAFLSYMSGAGPVLVANGAQCTCSNTVHAVQLKNGYRIPEIQTRWVQPICRLSCELEGHPLGGGMLKLEPKEAARVVLPPSVNRLNQSERHTINDALTAIRRWRHYE